MNNQLNLLFATINALPMPDAQSGGGRLFSVAPYPDVLHHRIGKDAAGNVAILLSIDPTVPVEPLRPVVLENLSVVHAARCKVRAADGELESGIYTVVTCTSSERSLVRLFLTIISPLIRSLPERPTFDIAAAAIRQMIRLFQLLKKPSTRSIQGLWGELFVIRQARNTELMVKAWHADPFEQFDFADHDDRLEVKTTTRPSRSHQFSFVQLRPIAGIRPVVASLQVVRITNGLTLSRLWHDVRARVDHDATLLARVDKVVTSSLGRAWRRGLGSAFDETAASASLSFYEARSIPAVDPTPAEVTEVRFRSDLSGVTPLMQSSLRLLGPLFEAAALR